MKDTGRLYGPSLLYIDGVWWFVIPTAVSEKDRSDRERKR